MTETSDEVDWVWQNLEWWGRGARGEGRGARREGRGAWGRASDSQAVRARDSQARCGLILFELAGAVRLVL